MPKKSSKSALEQIAWVTKLPEKGGGWGRALVSTVTEMEKEAEPLRKEFEDLSERLAVREGIVKDAIKRAEREVKGLFNERQVAEAKKAAEKHQEDENSKARDSKVNDSDTDNGGKSASQPRA